MRGLAYVVAGIAQKTVLEKFKLTYRMQASLLLAGISFILFYYSYNNPFILAIVSFVLNLACGSIEVLVNVCLIMLGKSNVKHNASLSYGIYGVGGMIGPIFVSFFGVKTLLFMAGWMIVLGLYYTRIH
jgi:hypothetical protein